MAGDTAQHPKKAAFLRAYALTGNISRAAEVAEVSRQRFYIWCEHDDGFKAAADAAKQEAADRLEHFLFERAGGAARTVKRFYAYQNGRRVLVSETEEDGPSDTAAIFLLKGIRPEKYRERLDVTQTQVVKAVDAAAWDSV